MQEPAAHTSQSSTTLIAGRYVVARPLGIGGVGAVYVVFDKATGSRMALKRLRADAGERAGTLFAREYRTLAGLSHPGIVEVFDYGLDEEGAFYTMALVEGADLSENAPIPWRKACRVMRDTASILGLLHARRLLHRDPSPRNLIETPAGRLKLIDFGALADFGPAVDVAGTPPYVPPEALGGSLDQRSDLFSLGALGYWLVTGAHAYPARTLGDLPQLWKREPAAASQLLRAAGDRSDDPPPPELDALLAQLLRVDPEERPCNTAALIDRLNALAQLAPEASDEAISGYLQSKAFVGRERELAHVNQLLACAREGYPQAVLIEGEPGVGRSRLLQEIVVSARLSGAITLTIDKNLGSRPYALAESALAQLERALPVQTRALMQPHARALAPISPLRSSAGGAVTAAEQSFGEARARLQSALLSVFADVAQTQLVALVVDDLQSVDEESLAWLSALTQLAAGARLCLCASVVGEVGHELTATVHRLRRTASQLSLLPLEAHETRELLRSVFDEVPYLDRLAERLHRSAAGNPAHCLELAQHLVETGAASYSEGSWTLPMELEPEQLPLSRRAGLVARLDRLPLAARALAQSMSVPHRAGWSVEHVASVADVSCEQAKTWLALLVQEGVLRVREELHFFSHEPVRQKLQGELEPYRARASHKRIGRLLASSVTGDDVAVMLCGCAHWIRAGDLFRAYPLLKRALCVCVEGEPAHIALHAAAFEELLSLLSAAQQDDYALCGPLGMLAVSGYFKDRRYALQYGEQALATLQRVLKLQLAHELKPRIGAKPALVAALALAAAGVVRHHARSPSVPQLVRLMLLAASTLAGTAAICMDPDRAGRFARTLGPFTALGPNHAATVIHDFSMLMELQGRDRPARCVAAFSAMIARLGGEGQAPIAALDEQVRASYYAGAHLPLGVFLVRRDDRAGLTLADRLEQFSPLYAMSADHLRANYYAAQGDTHSAQAARRRVEVHAVQLGSAWQVETWAPVDVLNIAWRMSDADEMKRALLELRRLQREIPSLAKQALYARVSYLVLRGNYREAIELYEETDDPAYSMNGWMRMRGVLAHAYNALGEHTRARQICLSALAGADPDERQFVVMNLGVEIELALAEAGLGLHETAHERIEQLMSLHAPHGSAITLGSLREAQGRISLLEGDFVSTRRHLEAARALYRTVGGATLLARARTLAGQLAEAERSDAPQTLDQDGELDPALLATRARLLLRDRASGEDPARGCLGIALELCGACEGFLLLANAAPPVTFVGETGPGPELLQWATQHLSEPAPDQQTVVTATKRGDRRRSDSKIVGDRRYRAVPLRAARAGHPLCVAVLVIGALHCEPELPRPEVLRAIASHLARASDSSS